METHPLDSLEEQPGDVPEDVAILHSWANMEGAKYRDFSASRREYRAQMRHRAAEQLRQMELQAQVEAEAAARQAEEAAAVAHARAEEASARLMARQGPRSGSRSFNGSDRADLTHDSREEQERLKAASLRSAVQQARKAAMEREEASKRAKAAAFAESIARREEQEIAEAQTSAIRQAAQYAEAGGRPRGDGAGLQEWIPGEISDPYTPPRIDEEERFGPTDVGEDGPGWMFVPMSAPAAQAPARLPEFQHRDAERFERREAEDGYEMDAARNGRFVDDSGGRHPVNASPSEESAQTFNREAPTNQPLVAELIPASVEKDENQARAQVEVVYRLPADPGYLATGESELDSHDSAPAAVRTLVTEFSPVEALSVPQVQQVRGGKSDATGTREDTNAVPVVVKNAAQDTAASDPSVPIVPQVQTSRTSLPPVDHPAPAWLYPARHIDAPRQRDIQPDAPISPSGGAEVLTRSLESSKESMATRWFGLRRVFGRRDAESEREPTKEKVRQAPILAVFSIAGGVGKTSLVATLGCALSRLGEKVLLGDAASHSLLPYYFGSSKRLPGVVRMFCPPPEVSGMPVHLVNYDPASETHGVVAQTKIADALLANSLNTNRMLLDLSVNGQGIFDRLREFQPTVLVPLIAEMNSVISIEVIETMFDSMVDAEGRPLKPIYLLNQFDATLPLQLDIREILKQQLGERLLPFVIRRSSGVSEALAEGMTIVDYDPESPVAQDYFRVSNWLRSLSVSVGTGLRNQRWSEQ